MSYCRYVQTLPPDHVSRHYHDAVYGVPVVDDALLFERLVLEINQAGLSWETILRKQVNFRLAFEGYDIRRIAAYGEEDVQRLLDDRGIIRNRLKIAAVIHNAAVVLAIQETWGSFHAWLDQHKALHLEGWTKLFRTHFRFTGPEIVREFLVSTAFLPGAHEADCPVGHILSSRG